MAYESHLMKNVTRYELENDQYLIGVSTLYPQISDLDRVIQESLMAHKVALIEGKTLVQFDETGVYCLLLPFHDDYWMRRYHQTIIMPLKQYDQSYQSGLFETAMTYVNAAGDIKKTAQDLFIHANTVRYRLSKIKELLSLDAAEGELFTQLNLAVKLDQLFDMK